MLITSLWVGLGGALGSMGRFWTALVVTRLLGDAFPWATLLINVLGSFVIGCFGTLTLPGGPLPATPGARAFVMAGICGGYTTFSAFSLQTWDLMRAGDWVAACGNVGGSVVLCVGAAMVGYWVAMRFGG